MSIKRVFTSEGVKVQGRTEVDVVGYLMNTDTKAATPDVTVYIRERAVNINFGMSPDEARRFAAGLVNAADASEAAAREAQTVPLPLAETPKAGVIAALVLFLGLSLNACATAPRPPEVETVGALSASYHSIAVAPVHAGTDLSAGFQAVDTDETPVVAGAGEAVEAPEVAAKGGLMLGAAR